MNPRYAGKWYQAAREGRLFTYNAAVAGIVLPIYSNTAQKFGLWNPSDSGVNLVMASLRMTYVDTTGAAGGYCWGLLRDAGANIATAAPISAYTKDTPERGIMGPVGGANKVRPMSTITVTTGIMVVGRSLGINQLVLTAADATTVPWTMREDYDGDFVVAPGNAVFLCGHIAMLTKWAPTASWVEEPI